MKKFEAPEMEISKFALEDVITTSGTEEILPTSGEDMGGWA